MELRICVPSYKRPHGCTVLKYLPQAEIFVDAQEVAAYQASYPTATIHGCPPGIQGNLPRVKNYILDQYPGDAVCMVDDDLIRVGWIEGGEYHYITDPEHFMAFLRKFTIMALDLGTVLWGVNTTHDKQSYREQRPFVLVNYIGGPFQVHVASDIRYDEVIYLKEDYDISLQVLNKYRKVLRVNRYFYECPQGVSGDGQPGGVAQYRTLAKEEEHVALLIKKWGSDIVRRDQLGQSKNHTTKKIRTFDCNPVIKPPIKST